MVPPVVGFVARKRRSESIAACLTIFTTNKPLTEWGKALHDEGMATAILDRVLEHGRFIHLDGPSGRTRHLNLEETLPAATDRARIPGIGVPEFREPTPLDGFEAA